MSQIKAFVQQLFNAETDDSDGVFTPEKLQNAANHLNLSTEQTDSIIDQLEIMKVAKRSANGYINVDPMMASTYLK